MVTGVAAWLLLVLSYLLFAGQVSGDEAVAGAAAAVIGAACVVLVRAVTGRPIAGAVTAPWGRVLVVPARRLASDAWLVGRSLVRASLGRGGPGSVAWQPFRHGGKLPVDAGRRALVTLAMSLAPNEFVLDLPGEADAILMHRLAPAHARADREWPL